MTDSTPAVRAADEDRDRVALALRDHQVAGRLTLDEFSERIDLAQRARSLDELEELTRDLPATTGTELVPATTRRATRLTLSIMGGSNRRGRWRVEGRTTAMAIMGGINLDLRRAEIVGQEVTVNAISLMGGVNVTVPEGIPVEITGFVLMGGKNDQLRDVPPLPGSPRIHIRVFGLMGGVNVRSARTRA